MPRASRGESIVGTRRGGETLRQLPDLVRHLRPQHSEAQLERKAQALGDAQAARSVPDAKGEAVSQGYIGRKAQERQPRGAFGPFRGFATDPTGAAPLRPALENLKTFPREEKNKEPGGGASVPCGSFFN